MKLYNFNLSRISLIRSWELCGITKAQNFIHGLLVATFDLNVNVKKPIPEKMPQVPIAYRLTKIKL
jgi:hypothetical protein